MVKKRQADELLDNDRLLTIAEVARTLHVSRSLIYWLIGGGELPTVRIGRALRFRSEDVQAYIRRRTEALSDSKSGSSRKTVKRKRDDKA